jgi:hypothetical protein
VSVAAQEEVLEFVPGGEAQREPIVRISDYLDTRDAAADRAVGQLPTQPSPAIKAPVGSTR